MTEQKVIVITGSTRGIGFGMSKALLSLGNKVVVNGRSEESVTNCLAKLNAESFCTGLAGDISEYGFADKLFLFANERYGKVDIWINNAGLSNDYLPLEKLEEVDIEAIIRCNIIGSIFGSRAALKGMKEQGFGRIFNMEGLGSDGRQIAKLGVYGTSKSAIAYFARSLKKELEGGPVKSGVISPGMVMTDMIRDSLQAADEKDRSAFNKISSVLAEDVETVAPFLAKRILAAEKDFENIKFLTGRKVAWRFMSHSFRRKKS